MGHISYLVVRMGPVFRLGSLYIPEDEKHEWKNYSDMKKIRLLISGQYPWLSVELIIHMIATTYFIYLRLITYGTFTEECAVI
jgi:hypothetical protein